MWRAMLEAVAFGLRHHVEVLSEIGHEPRRFMASDGGTASRLWMQITADVLAAPVQLLDNDYGSAVGAAFVAAIGAGLTSDWGSIRRLSRHGVLVQPDAERSAVYDEMYRRYRELYLRLAPFFHEAGSNPIRRAATTR